MGQQVEKNVYCKNEYDSLNRVIMTPPKYMAITEVINETQNHYLEDNININIAMEQYNFFVDTLQREGVRVEELTPKEKLNEQVFTRDIGFVIGNQLFVSYMKKDIRQKEVHVLEQWLEEEAISFEVCSLSSIEGGDVIIDGKQIWVGISERTSLAALDELQNKLPDYTLTAVPLRKDILHLDCAFNIFDDKTALLYPDAVSKEIEKELRANYQIIDVTEEEQFYMGPNVLAIGENKIISLPENERINKELSNMGYTVIEVPFSEIIKSGGSYRCCTLPLKRQ